MNRHPDADRHPPPIVVTGMHRSGVSLAAALVAGAGARIVGDPAVRSGDHAACPFRRLHERMLAANGLSRDGHTCAEGLTVPPRARGEAVDLINRHLDPSHPWGWDDPRATLFLDLWQELLPEARFLFVVRPAEEVVDSLFRHGDEPFTFNPRFAIDVWVAYNRRIRDFVRCHANRCLVVEHADVTGDANGFVDKVSALLQVPLTPPPAGRAVPRSADEQMARSDCIVAALRPDARELLTDLRILAGTAPCTIAAGPAADLVADAALSEWAAASVARGTAARLQTDLDAARCEIARLEAIAAEASPATLPFAADRADGDPLPEDRGAGADLATAWAEAAALAEQLQAERECFEALRLDLVARLEAATAGSDSGRLDRKGRGRKSVAQRVAAECRRFVRRLGERRRRAAQAGRPLRPAGLRGRKAG